jgi:hypothetical protein
MPNGWRRLTEEDFEDPHSSTEEPAVNIGVPGVSTEAND